MRITQRWLETVRPRAESFEVYENGRKGFHVRVYPSRSISFRFRYKRDGVTRIMTLGEFSDSYTLADAHEAHEAQRALLRRGIDPVAHKELEANKTMAQARAEADAPTVRNVIAEWLWHYARRERKRPREAARMLRANVVKHWGDKRAKDVTRRDAVLLLDRVKARGAAVGANRIAALLVQVFSFAVERGLLEASPLVRLPRPGGSETPRDRILTDDEILAFWTQLETAKTTPATRIALRLLLVTAQRRGEVTGARWQEFDLENAVWRIPAERAKTAKPHAVPLSGLALGLLVQLRALSGDSDFLVPTAHKKAKAGENASERLLSRAVRNNEDHFGIPHFTPHDLRRSAASGMTRLGVPRLHVEKVLGHAIADVAEIYDRHDYAAEKRTALDKWSAHLQGILSGKSASVTRLKVRA